jgi:hypothetical protein
MSIEFIRDEFLEGKKEELDKIDEELSKKPIKKDKSAIFLKRFTLALMGQYKPHQKLFNKKHEEINILNKQILQETQRLHEFRPIQRRMPQQPLTIPTPQGLQIPIPQQMPRLQVPRPLKEELRIPEPIPVNNIPQKQTFNQETKKEFTAPKPI